MPRSQRRSTKVCTRCRKRKTKCDFKFPACTTCALAGATCQGFDPLTREAVPRSLVKSLEDRIAELEMQLAAFPDLFDNTANSLASVIAQATTSYGVPPAETVLRSEISSKLLLRPSCPPLAVARKKTQPADDPSFSPGNRSSRTLINLTTIPYSAIARMVQNYAEVHLPQYPCITESMLLDIIHRTQGDQASPSEPMAVYGIPAASSLGHFEYFVLFITLAISALTLTWKDEDQARNASGSFFNSALKHFRAISGQTEIQSLQSALLLAHFAHMCPERVDNWTCIAKAVRIVLSLGLYALETDKMVTEHDRLHNELFWVTYGMERSLCTNLRLPLSFPEDIITTSFTLPQSGSNGGNSPPPSPETQPEPSAQHIYRYRRLETEVHRVLHLCEPLTAFDAASIEDWTLSVTQRLTVWYEQAQVYTLFNMLEFKHVQFYHLRARIHRPTPRLRARTDTDRGIVLESARELINDYLTQEERRRLFYPWHGVHILFEAAVISLEACWSLASVFTFSDIVTQMLQESLPQCIQLLANIGERWNEATTCADCLRPLLTKVTTAFEERCTAARPTYDASEIAEELNDLIFSDGPLTWDQAPHGDAGLDTDDWLSGFENAFLDDSNLFEWNPEWDIMPMESL